MKTFLLYTFAALGGIFVLLLVLGAYLFVADPFGLRTSGDMQEATTATDRHPYLSPAQEAALETFGINPAALPTEVTPEMRTCAEAVLGEERVAEIESGARRHRPKSSARGTASSSGAGRLVLG